MVERDRTVASDTDMPRQEQIVKLRPTLFIGVGGTGMEVMLRVRRRILSAVWGKTTPVRLDSLADFPVAQFLHFDLDQGAVLESGKAQATDLMAELVKLTDDDRIVENFEIDRYSRSDGDLARFPHIEAWSPLTPKRIRELGIDPSKGAGQIRAIARLYFFDKYAKIRDKIRNKLTWLRTGLSKEVQLGRLGLELDQSKFRIVVIGSIAGGTGGGSFVDMGWLAGWQAKTTVSAAEIELVLFLPTGFASTNKDRTEANAYASLMELETYMREGSESFEQRWDTYDRPELLRTPYDEVYLVDSGNLAQLHTGEQRDVYDMVADALFEDFNSAEFAVKKRSVAVNQKQHKIMPFNAAVAENLYGDMKLSFYKGYSAFGQAILDTQGAVKRDIRAHHWVSAMLKAFFGVASGDGGNRATDKQRDDFMVSHMHLVAQPFSDFPDFSSREINLKLSAGEFYDYALTTDLLTDRHGATVAMMQQKVDSQVEQLAGGFERDQWPTQVREAVKQLEKDAVRDEDTTADVVEDRLSRRRRELFDEITAKLRDQLYNYLDNKEFGGLEFVLSLVEQIKARLENPQTGLAHAQTANAARYQEIKEALRTYEYERLLGNLVQTRGFGLFGAKDKQARVILDQLKVEIGNYLKFHLRAKAAAEGAQLLRDLSKWLGERVDVDAAGNARWNGLVGELQAGRQAVLAMLADIDQRVALLREDVKKDHATYLRVDVAERDVPLPSARQLREWADEAFKDFGGSRRLFPMLQESQLRSGLFAKLRHKAEAQMPVEAVAGRSGPDPLIEALRAMPPVERHRRFSELLSRAMPWIDANLGREYTPNADQYRCYIGVGNADEWKQFQEELFAQTPTQAGITARQLSFVNAGIPGRAVCYTELSGIPLAVLRGLETWRTSYRKESERIPLHTHRDATKFTHPCVPTTGDLARLADDFKTFLLGVMLRVLVRDSRGRVFPPGQYQFTIGRGDVRRMGNERAFRLNGLPPNFRQQIHDAIQARVELLDKTQLGALAALALAYATEVYTSQLVPDETGAEIASKGFAAAVAEQLSGDLKERARRKGASERELQRIEQLCSEARLGEWTDAVPDSDADAYGWEVRDSDEPRLKRTVSMDFFTPGWLDANVLTSRVAPSVSPGVVPPPPPPTYAGASGPPPQPPAAFQYYVMLNNQRSGPHPFAHLQHWIGSGQLAGSVLAWREGLVGWMAVNQVPELAVLFASVPPPPLPGGGPPPFHDPKAAE